MAGQASEESPNRPYLVDIRTVAQATDPAQGKEAPADWERPALWTPGCLIAVAVANVTFDDPGRGRVSLDVSIWRDPLDPQGRYSAMVETW